MTICESVIGIATWVLSVKFLIVTLPLLGMMGLLNTATGRIGEFSAVPRGVRETIVGGAGLSASVVSVAGAEGVLRPVPMRMVTR